MIRPSFYKAAISRTYLSIRLLASASRAVKIDKSKIARQKSWTEIPGPQSLPFIGNILHFLPGGSLNGKLGYDLLDHLYKTYGPIVKLKVAFNPQMIFIFDPEAIAKVFHGENLDPIRPSLQSFEYYRKKYNKKKSGNQALFNGSTGLITEHGKEWKEFRSIVNPVLLHPETVKHYGIALDEVAMDMVKRIQFIRNEKNMVPDNFDYEINKWSLESISTVALGTRLGCLENDFAEDSPAGRLIKIVNEVQKIGLELDFSISLWKYYPTPGYKKAMSIYDEQVSLTRHFIQQAIEDIANKKASTTQSDKETGVLEKLLNINENVAIIMANDMLVGGVDTTSHAMLPALYLLAKNPEKQEILRQEIISNKDQKYLKAVFKECFRVMPAVSGNLRVTRKEYNICGYKIPQNTSLFFCHQYISLMDSQYPRPREFIPERWIVGKDDPLYYGNAQNFSYLPFGFGTRQCIGKRIVQLEFETLLSRLVKNFNIEWEGPEPKINPSALNYFTGPFGFVFKDIH